MLVEKKIMINVSFIPQRGGVMKWALTSFIALMLAFPVVVSAQESSGSFTDGSVQVGFDNRTCVASLEGAIRYNSGGGSGGKIEFCSDGSGSYDWAAWEP